MPTTQKMASNQNAIGIKIIPVILFLMLSFSRSECQVISTISGNGTSGFSGDGGAAVNAQLEWPQGVTTDSSGNIYIVDCWNNRIRRIDTNLIINTKAGDGTPGYSGDGADALNANLYQPSAAVLDNTGNMFIADYYNHVVRKVDRNGIISTVAGNNVPGYNGDGIPATSASLNLPIALAFDRSGNLLIAELGNHRVRKVNSAGIITTIIGNGTEGVSGDEGPAVNANLTGPAGIAVAPSGNIYITDYTNPRVRKIDTSGIIHAFAGTGTAGYSGDGSSATAAMFGICWGIAADHAENIYFADYGNHCIRRVGTDGMISTVAGNGTPGNEGDGSAPTLSRLNSPQGITINRRGELFIADRNNHRIRKITPFTGPPPVITNFSPAVASTGAVIILRGSYFNNTLAVNFGGTPAASFTVLSDSVISAVLSTGSTGKVDIITVNGKAEREGFTYCTAVLPTISVSSTLTSVVPGEAVTFTASDQGSINPSYQWKKNNIGVGINSTEYTDSTLQNDDSVWCELTTNTSCAVTVPSNKVYLYSSSAVITTIAGTGSMGYDGDSIPATSAQLRFPDDIAADDSGNIFISDLANFRIRKVDSLGQISTLFGNGIPSPSYLGASRGITIDKHGYLYVADPDNSRILKIKIADGSITRVAGRGDGGYGYGGDGGPATSAWLRGPVDVTIDAAGNLYIADTHNSCIRKVDANGIITTVAGNGTEGYSGDNGPATAAQLYQPAGVAVDSHGNIFISDTYNHVIRKVDNNGIITSITTPGGGGFGDGGPAMLSTFYAPGHMEIDGDDNLYIIESIRGRTRRINKNGIVHTIAGREGFDGFTGDGGPAVAARFASPNGVVVNKQGYLFIADGNNQRIRKIGLPKPQILGFAPDKGPTGTVVTLNGKYVRDITAISFGDSAATFTVVNDSTVNAVVGNGATGTVKVTSAAGTVETGLFTFVSRCYWTGAADNRWENPLNWSCGRVPDNNTSVFINSGTVILNTNSTVWSLTVSQNAVFTIVAPNQLIILH